MQTVDKGIDLWVCENSNRTLPGRTSISLFLVTDLFSNTNHKTCLQLYDLIAAVLSDNFITTFLLSSLGIIYELFLRLVLSNEIEIILGLPTARAIFKEKVGVVATELPVCSISKIAKWAIYDSHWNSVWKIAGWDPAQRASVNADLTFDL